MWRAVIEHAVLLVAVSLACGPSATLPTSTDLAEGAAAMSAAASARPTPVAVLVHTPSQSTSTLPLTVARHMGYYAEEGIDLEERPMPPNVGMAALLSGEVHFSSAATSSLSAAAKGAPIRLVISLAERPSHVLVGAKGMSSPEELRGGMIASSSPGGVQYREAQAALRYFGIDPQDVTLAALPNDAVRQAALEGGAARAAVLTMPFNFKLEQQGYPRLLNFAEGDLIRLPVGALSGTLDYLAQNSDVVMRTLRATLRGLRAMRENKAVTVSALQDFFQIDETTASALYDAVVSSYTIDGRIAASAIRAAIETEGVEVHQIDPLDLVDYRYLDEASQTLR